MAPSPTPFSWTLHILLSILKLLPNTRTLRPSLLPLLIRLTQRIIQPFHPLNLPLPPPPLLRTLNLAHQIHQALRRKELIPPVIQRPLPQTLIRISLARNPEDLLQDIDIIRNGKQIPAILVRKQVVELVEARPGDAAETQRARLVRGEEDAVLGRGAAFRGGGEELLDAVYLAVEEGRGALVVGGYCHGGEARAGEDGGAEELAAG